MPKTSFVAKAIVVNSSNQFLLLIRSDTHPTLAGLYDLPGGMIEPGEEPGKAVEREIHEETGLKIENARVLYATTMMIDSTSYPTLLYYVNIEQADTDITLSWEHMSYEWAELERLEEVEPQLAPTYREALTYIKSNQIIEDL